MMEAWLIWEGFLACILFGVIIYVMWWAAPLIEGRMIMVWIFLLILLGVGVTTACNIFGCTEVMYIV